MITVASPLRAPKLLIDCDPGLDDALAIMLAQATGELVGITTVSGNASLEAVTDNALALLSLLDQDVPVHAGAAGPLQMPADGRVPDATHVHGARGLGDVALPAHRRRVASNDAVGFLLESARQHSDLNVIAIGPLTNLARAVEADATFAGRLGCLSIMGGSTGGGNVTATAEFNIWADPEAGDIVFRSGAPIRLAGLNLTHQLKTSAAFRSAVAAIDTAQARVALAIIDYLHGRMLELTGEAAAALHDPCAVLAVTHPELINSEDLPVAVALDGALTRGMTVIDQRWAGRRLEPRLAVGQGIDADAALTVMLDALRPASARSR
ncbi:MAG: nucleoside hydrolase [Pseudomonadota bacterium]